MKKTKKWIASLLSLVTLAATSVGFVGCGEDTEASVGATTEATDVVTFANFDAWKPSLQLMRLMPSAGKCRLNTDSAYIKGGSGSAAFYPLGRYTSQETALFYMPTYSNLFGYNYKDFSKVEFINMWFYNSHDTDLTIKIGLVSDVTSVTKITCLEGEEFTLKAGQWQEVTYFVDFAIMSLTKEIKSTMVESIQGIYFEFPNSGARYFEDSPVIYCDEIKLGFKAEGPVYEDVTNDYGDVLYKRVKNDLVVLEDGEILDFEKLYQKYICTYSVRQSTSECIPSLEVVNAADYGLLATSGYKMLKFTTHYGAAETDNVWSNLTDLVIPSSILDVSAIKTANKEDYANTYFCFDVYNNDFDVDENGNKTTVPGPDMTFAVYVSTKDGRQDGIRNFTAKVGEWYHFKISLQDMIKDMPDLIDNISAINIRYGSAYDNADGTEDMTDRELFFDNFRIEKEA